MPRARLYASDAERQAAYNERKRQVRLEAERKQQEEVQRVARLQIDCRRAVGMLIESAPTASVNNKLQGLGYGTESAAECHAYIQRIAASLKTGKNWIP